MEDGPKELLEKYTFPKKVGIVFLERRERAEDKSTSRKKRGELLLDFDQDACAFLLLQMNQHQNIFEFQIVDIPDEEIPRRIPLKTRIGNLIRRMIRKCPKENDLLGWVDKFAKDRSDLSIDYWMGITSDLLPMHKTWHFHSMPLRETKSFKRLWIITSRNWEKYRSPPSLFEYLIVTMFRCALESLSRQLQHGDQKLYSEDQHTSVTRGCIFDFTHRRISVSIFNLCFSCNEILSLLGNSIWQKGYDVNLVEDVTTILSKEWMGTPEKRDSPLFNLKKMYKYDVDRNSGFYKKWYQRITDSMIDNLAQWIVGSTIAGIISIGLYVIFGIEP